MRAAGRRHRDHVVVANVSQCPKERVPVAGEYDVAAFAGQRRTGHVAHSTLENPVIGALEDNGGYIQPRNLQPSDQMTLRWSGFPCCGLRMSCGLRMTEAIEFPVAFGLRSPGI